MKGKAEQSGQELLSRGVGQKGPPQETQISVPHIDTNVPTLPWVTFSASQQLEGPEYRRDKGSPVLECGGQSLSRQPGGHTAKLLESF